MLLANRLKEEALEWREISCCKGRTLCKRVIEVVLLGGLVSVGPPHLTFLKWARVCSFLALPSPSLIQQPFALVTSEDAATYYSQQ